MKTLGFTVLIIASVLSKNVAADNDCNEIRICFDKMVEIANSLVEQNKRLERKLQQTEELLSREIAKVGALANENSTKLVMGAYNCEWVVVGGGIQGAKKSYCPAGKVMTGIEQHYDGGKGWFRHWIQHAQCCSVHNF